MASQTPPQVVVVGTQPIAITPTTTADEHLSSYAKRVPARILKAHLIMGAMQTSIGCLVFLLGIINHIIMRNYSYCYSYSYYSYSYCSFYMYKYSSGVWAGSIFIIAGALGIKAAKGTGPTRRFVIACMVFSIFSACLAALALAMDGIFSLTIINAICMFFYSCEFILSIVQASYCCNCCMLKPARAYQQPQVAQAQQVFFIGQTNNAGQQVLFSPVQAAQPIQGQQWTPGSPNQQAPGFVMMQAPGNPIQQAPGFVMMQAPAGNPNQQAPGFVMMQAPGNPNQQAPGFVMMQAPAGNPNQQAPGFVMMQEPGNFSQQAAEQQNASSWVPPPKYN